MPAVIPYLMAMGMSYGTASTVVTVAIAAAKVGAAMAVSYGMQKLLGEDMPQMDGAGMLANKASAIAPIKVIYGERRVGATRVFVSSSGSKQNKKQAHRELHMVLAIAEGEIESFEKIWINDTQYEIDGVVNERFEVMHGNVPVIEFNEHLGAWDQAADDKLIDRLPDQWTANHKLSGVAYIYVRLYHDRKVFYSGIPTFTFDVKGVKVFDPRTGATAWSDNPALSIRDYLTNKVYGRGIPEAHIDDSAIISAADYCDELVSKGTSDSSKQEISSVNVPVLAEVATPSTHAVATNMPGSGLTRKIVITADSSLQYTGFGALRFYDSDGTLIDLGDRTDTSITEASFSNGVKITASSSWSGNGFSYYVGSILDSSLTATVVTTDGYWVARYSGEATITITFNDPVQISSLSVVTNPDLVHHGNREASLVAKFYGDELYDKRYTCNGIVNVDKKAMDNLSDLLTSCRGMMIFSGGKYRLLIDRPTSVTGTASADNITGSWNISLGDKSTTFNSVRAKFFNKNETWQDDQVVIERSELKELDNGLVLQADLKLPFTSDVATAKQIALANLKQSRQQIYAEFTATIVGMVIDVGDVINITHPTPGWDAKPFRILKMSLQPNDEILIGCREYDESVYDLSDLVIHDDIKSDTNLPNLDTCLPPTDMVSNEEITYAPPSLNNIAPDDKLVTKATVTWQTNEPFADYADLEYRDPTTGEWIRLEKIESNTDKVSQS